MNILFIHGNHPAQFKYLSPWLGSYKENNVIFLTEKDPKEIHSMQGVRTHHFQLHRGINTSTHHYLYTTEECVLRGQAVIRELDILMSEGFTPNLIVYHGGMGYGLFLQELLPHTTTIGYFEWWFNSNTSKYLFKELEFDTKCKSDMRNMVILKEIEACSRAITPTDWQKRQFPKIAIDKLEVIFDGIDQEFFCEDQEEISGRIKLSGNDTNQPLIVEKSEILVTYATRGMEPLRGFPEFMKLLPDLFDRFNNIRVIVAGQDRAAYSYGAPTDDGSWKKYFMQSLSQKIDINSIHFTGLMSYIDYRKLLRRSDLHIYFTRPYVTSWSFFEAAACKAILLASKNDATDGIVAKDSVYWIDLDDPKNIKETALGALEVERAERKRSKLKDGFDLNISLGKWNKLINESMGIN